jgi:hypothetical protein
VFFKAQLEEGGCLKDEHLAALFLGPTGFVRRLSDLAEDIPRAPVLTGRMLGDFVAAGRVPLRPVVDAFLEEAPRREGDDAGGDDEEEADPPLVDAEKALPMVVALLNRWRDVAGDDGAAAKAAWAATGLEWAKLQPGFARSDADVADALKKADGEWLA